MPELLLLTNCFPYGAGEDYLEAELPHLAAAFDRVVVVPTMQVRGQPPTRQVPEGVVVVPVDLPPGRAGRLMTPLGELRRGAVGWGLPHLPTAPPFAPVPHAYEAYFEARAQGIARLVTVRLAEAGIAVPEVVYAYWFYVTTRVATLLAVHRPEGRPVVVARAHGYDVDVEASPVGYLPQRGLLLREVDHLFPVSERAAERLRTGWPEHADKISVRRLGSVGSSAAPVSRQHPMHVLTVSSVRRRERLHLVADAVGLLQRDGVPVTWTHLGGGTPAAEAALRRRAARMAPGSVELVGPVPRAEVLHRLATCRPTVLVNVSMSEGVPMSVMEAMAHGVPVLATDVGAARELLLDQPALPLLPPDLDTAYLAGALLGVDVLPPSAYARVCAANQAAWRAGWDAGVVLADFASELASLAGQVRR
ncbi:glycosyltransferase [Ornithinimicrobium pekingense]|uniref:Glycosyl transferase family 1 n=1 Tax=Ornithinimicrobium pekingense TaxID=384677 RepID=A0ABQ2F8G7_9MICO|nr:glycosyltransferase [Ornithinimicrobium pekingense]GGK71076.1 glycosyl transferase family 1 [Ornithinimicrobium pekingense]